MIGGCVVETYVTEDRPRLSLQPATAGVAAGPGSGWRAPVWVAPVFALAAVLLLPWIVLLVVALPSSHRAAHWDVAWAGFDVMLALLLLTVAITAWRRSPWLEGAATAAATLLFVDAWFDVLTSSTRAELVVALVEAVAVELPLAVVCLLIARSAEHRLSAPRVSLAREPSDVGSAVGEASRAA
jgi:ascorbate-specific PTS system EIIC-type component UlaA